MRYFKYENKSNIINIAFEEQYKTLTKDEKRIVHKEKLWRKISTIVSIIVFFFCMIAGIYLINLIPQPSGWLWTILVTIGKVIIGIVLLIVSGFLTLGLTSPLWNKADSFDLPTLKKEIISKACNHLRVFYQLQEPYVVTKCFDATDKRFKNHDVCIFVVGDELRITANLREGFLYGERDLGCYAFKRNEITLSKQQEGKQLILELKADDTVFLLGYRAKEYIKKNFTT